MVKSKKRGGGGEKENIKAEKRRSSRCGTGEYNKSIQLTSRCRGIESASGSGRVISRQLIRIVDDDSLGWYALALSSLSGDWRCRHRSFVSLFGNAVSLSRQAPRQSATCLNLSTVNKGTVYVLDDSSAAQR